MTPKPGLAHSVHVRLVAHAKEVGVEAQLMLVLQKDRWNTCSTSGCYLNLDGNF